MDPYRLQGFMDAGLVERHAQWNVRRSFGFPRLPGLTRDRRLRWALWHILKRLIILASFC
jgi:hypothetical protein